MRGSSGAREASRDGPGDDVSSGFAIRSPPKALDKLRSPFMATESAQRGTWNRHDKGRTGYSSVEGVLRAVEDRHAAGCQEKH